jgi:hypothetical protein
VRPGIGLPLLCHECQTSSDDLFSFLDHFEPLGFGLLHILLRDTQRVCQVPAPFERLKKKNIHFIETLEDCLN